MTAADFRIRRATVDDLPALRALWQNAKTLPLDLEKRFTEIQVAELAEGQIAGAIGLKIERMHGQVHSEIVADPAHSAPLQEAFWQRLQILARNHGLFRLWTLSREPYWDSVGFRPPGDKEKEKMPAGFGTGEFLTLPLKEETAEGLSVEKEFELFTQSQRMETERLMQQAQTFRKFAYWLLAIAIVGFFVAAGARFLKSPWFKKGRK
jgi:N-acetylglutamate synthase-like GNAT family acetyltransferase